jgi:hypothetical protein
MAIGRERIAGGLAMQNVGGRILITKAPVNTPRGLIQEARHFSVRPDEVDDIKQALDACKEEG